jgi:hypothetical protein
MAAAKKGQAMFILAGKEIAIVRMTIWLSLQKRRMSGRKWIGRRDANEMMPEIELSFSYSIAGEGEPFENGKVMGV